MPLRVLAAVPLVRLLGAWLGRGPAYRDLAAALRLLILDGRVPLGVALPGERDLAQALGLSRTTVAAAYALLREEGHLRSRRGTRSVTAVPTGLLRTPAIDPGPGAGEGVLDLAYATLPAPPEVHDAYAAALQALPAHLPGHGYEARGLPSLRAAIAERYRARGLPTTPEQILVTSGAQHALAVLLRQLTGPGDRVLVDHPTYAHALDAMRHAGCVPVPVALAEDGWDIDGLRAAVRQAAPRLAYLVVDFHNPTGAVMSDADRAAVARLAHEGRLTVVVDEALADLALDGPPPPPLAAFDPHGRVVVTGSTSKAFWGGLRVGWVRGPAPLIARLAVMRTTLDLGTPIVEQLATEALLARAEPILRRRRAALREQRAVLLEAVARELPEWRVAVPPGGLTAWAELPAPISTALAAAAERHGVRVAAGPRFGVDGAFERHLRLPFTLPPDDLAEAIRRLGAAAAGLRAEVGGGTLAAAGLA